MNACRLNFILVLVIILVTCWDRQVYAQDVKLVGQFQADSFKIGEPVAYSFTARYPQHLTLLFPDSLYNFAPFEFDKKAFFSTKTTNGISYDSTVYYLTSFELDKIQKLALPAYIVSVRDCTAIAAEADSIYLVEVADLPTDSINAQNLPLKTDLLYEDVWYQFNYYIGVIILIGVAVISLIVWLAFGKRIIKYFKVKKIIKKHQQFIQTFSEHIEQLINNNSSERTEQTVLLWKRYMEQLDKKPYTKLTTRETIAVTPDEVLRESLKSIDGAIYGHSQNVIASLEYLKKFSENQFQKRLAEVKHG